MRNPAPSTTVNVLPSWESEQPTEQPRGRSLTDRAYVGEHRHQPKRRPRRKVGGAGDLAVVSNVVAML